ncbi:RHG32 protein, partial [Penelope pileata]|nr:RHG32 protein [Penelope pileata]
QLTSDTCCLVPQVIKSCAEFIEKYGIVDGIYRLSGVASNIQKLRHEFDAEQIPDLTKDTYIHDIHSVGSLCKLYFRELPNPLLTFQLYDKFT